MTDNEFRDAVVAVAAGRTHEVRANAGMFAGVVETVDGAWAMGIGRTPEAALADLRAKLASVASEEAR